MPDSGLVRSHEFDQSRRRLGAWLHAHMEDVRSLGDREVGPYREWKGVVGGWEVQSADSGRRFWVLIDGAFPFSRGIDISSGLMWRSMGSCACPLPSGSLAKNLG
jgi:hypothetical protein